MKAVICPRYGSPDVLKIEEIEKPAPKQSEVLIKVFASSINAYDHHVLRAGTFLVRAMGGGLFRPKNPIPGADVAGVVEAVGEGAVGFQQGDKVYGCLADEYRGGAFAEYVCAKPSLLAPMPGSLSFEQAAALPLAAVTALQGLRDVGKIEAGKSVLINGASGGVGGFAVQIAKAFGARVSAVCSAKNAALARLLGASDVIDYAVEDFSSGERRYDLILDIAANRSLAEYARALNENGVCAVVGFSGLGHILPVISRGKSTYRKQGKRIELVSANNSKGEDLLFLNRLIEEKKLGPVIDEIYGLEQIKEAFWHFEREHVKGKIVIKVAQ